MTAPRQSSHTVETTRHGKKQKRASAHCLDCWWTYPKTKKQDELDRAVREHIARTLCIAINTAHPCPVLDPAYVSPQMRAEPRR